MASIPFLQNIDLNRNYIENGAFQLLTSSPGTTVAGQFYFHSTNNELMIRNGANSAWITLSEGGGGTVSSVQLDAGNLIDIQVIAGTNPITATGQLQIDVDLSELTDMTEAVVKTVDEIVVLDNSVQKRKLFNEINLSDFNNDLNYDNYGSWDLLDDGVTPVSVSSTGQVQIAGGTGISVDFTDSTSPDYVIQITNDSPNVSTSLSIGTQTGTTLAITSDGGADDVTLPQAIASGNAGLMSGTDKNKLDNIEAGADVTDATNVAAAGAVMESDTSTASMSFVIDDDTFATATATVLASAESIKTYVDNATTGALVYQGGYNASTNSPDLDTSPSGITKGDTYTVTADGLFFTEAVQIGDMLVAEQTNPTLLSHWTVVNKNIPDIVDASTTAKGLAEEATQTEVNNGDAAGSEGRLFVNPSSLAAWPGTANITTLGTVTTGTWSATRLLASKVPQGSGFSVWGKTGTGTGDQGSIVATADQVLRRSGSGNLEFGTLVTNNLGANIVTYAKFNQSSAGFGIVGKADTGAGDFSEITAGADGVLRRSGSGNIAFGSLVTNNYSNNSVTYGKIQQATGGYKILAKAGTGGGNFAEVTAGTNSVLRRDGSGDIAFGQIDNGHIVVAADDTILGNITGASQTAQELTGTQVAGILPVAGNSSQGVVRRKTGTTVGGAATETITHNWGTKDVFVLVYANTNVAGTNILAGQVVHIDIDLDDGTSNNTLALNFASDPGTNYNYILIG